MSNKEYLTGFVVGALILTVAMFGVTAHIRLDTQAKQMQARLDELEEKDTQLQTLMRVTESLLMDKNREIMGAVSGNFESLVGFTQRVREDRAEVQYALSDLDKRVKEQGRTVSFLIRRTDTGDGAFAPLPSKEKEEALKESLKKEEEQVQQEQDKPDIFPFFGTQEEQDQYRERQRIMEEHRKKEAEEKLKRLQRKKAPPKRYNRN